MTIRANALRAFWTRVTPVGECWLWTGDHDFKGYGIVRWDDLGRPRRRRAHRVAWELANGSAVPEGMYVLHSCDNPPCIAPDHLFVGTLSDNSRDMWSKGRHPWTRRAKAA